MKALKTLTGAIHRANSALAAELERRAITALWKIASHHPEHAVVFCSAMGVWDWSIADGRYTQLTPPCNRLFERTRDDYGYNAIPAPIRAEIKDGKLTVLRDW